MKKINFVLGILLMTLVLVLTLRPVDAQAVNILSQGGNGEVSLILTSILTPIWYIVGRKAKQLLKMD